MPVSIVRNRYLLSEAFELVGRHLFGDEWTGNELDAQPGPSPDDLRAEYESGGRSRDEVDAEIEKLRNHMREKLLSEAETRQLQAQIEALQARRQAITDRLISPIAQDDPRVWLYENYQRRRTAEETLIGAIKEGKFPVWGGQLGMEPRLWSERHFRYSIELSIVRLPQTFSSKRHQSTRIPEAQFDSWLVTLKPLTPSAEKQLSNEDQCRMLFERWIAGGDQKKSKKEYFLEAKEEVPDLSWRAFDSLWRQRAPAEWRKFGRRQWPKQSEQPGSKA